MILIIIIIKQFYWLLFIFKASIEFSQKIKINKLYMYNKIYKRLLKKICNVLLLFKQKT